MGEKPGARCVDCNADIGHIGALRADCYRCGSQRKRTHVGDFALHLDGASDNES